MLSNREYILKINKLRSFINKWYGRKNTSCISTKDEISDEDLYYILKFYGIDINDYDDLKPINKLILNRVLNKYLGKDSLSTLRDLNIKDDNRILVIPRQIMFYSLNNHGGKPVIESTDELNIGNNTIALYLSNWEQVRELSRVLENGSDIDVLLIKEELKEDFDTFFGSYLPQYTISIPNDISSYGELTEHLNTGIKHLRKTMKSNK